MISNRPDELRLVQLPERLMRGPCSNWDHHLRRINGVSAQCAPVGRLAEEFELVLGSEVGYVASTPLQSVEIQSSNATVPLTMDGDTVRFSVDGDETSLSVRISDVLRMRRLSPLEEGALGPEGNSRVEMRRTSSEPLVLFEDTTMYDDPLLGLNGRVVIEPRRPTSRWPFRAVRIPMAWVARLRRSRKALRVCPSSLTTLSPSVE